MPTCSGSSSPTMVLGVTKGSDHIFVQLFSLWSSEDHSLNWTSFLGCRSSQTAKGALRPGRRRVIVISEALASMIPYIS